MKKLIILGAFGLALIVSVGVFAQKHRSFDGAKMLDKLTEELDLSKNQQVEVASILENQKSKAESLRENSELSREEKKGQMRAIKKEGFETISEVLTEEQRAKFEALKKERMGKRGHAMNPENRKAMNDLNERYGAEFSRMLSELEPVLSMEDKNKLASLRVHYKKVLEENEGKSPRELMHENETELKAIKEIGKKYQSDIRDILDKNKKTMEAYRSEMLAIHGKANDAHGKKHPMHRAFIMNLLIAEPS